MRFLTDSTTTTIGSFSETSPVSRSFVVVVVNPFKLVVGRLLILLSLLAVTVTSDTIELMLSENDLNALGDLLAKPPRPLLFCAKDDEDWASSIKASRSLGPQTIRFAQYNVWNSADGPDWADLRSKLVLGLLTKEQPEVIALNEVRISTNHSMFHDFCQRLNDDTYQGVFAPAMVHADGSVEGVAIFSKIPWKAVSSRALHFNRHQTRDLNRRVILGVEICLDHSRCLMVHTTHFAYDEKQRFGNAYSAWVFMTAFGLRHNTEAQPILLGDFNSRVEADSITRFFDSVLRLKDPAALKTTVENTYCNCGRPDQNCTLSVRPDRILVYDALEVTEIRAGPSGPINGVCPSDHRALFATVLVY